MLPHIVFKCRGALEINHSVCTGQRVGSQLIEGMAFFFKQIVVLFFFFLLPLAVYVSRVVQLALMVQNLSLVSRPSLCLSQMVILSVICPYLP